MSGDLNSLQHRGLHKIFLSKWKLRTSPGSCFGVDHVPVLLQNGTSLAAVPRTASLLCGFFPPSHLIMLTLVFGPSKNNKSPLKPHMPHIHKHGDSESVANISHWGSRLPNRPAGPDEKETFL